MFPAWPDGGGAGGTRAKGKKTKGNKPGRDYKFGGRGAATWFPGVNNGCFGLKGGSVEV